MSMPRGKAVPSPPSSADVTCTRAGGTALSGNHRSSARARRDGTAIGIHRKGARRPGCRLAVEMEIEEGLRPLARPIPGVGDREPVEPSARDDTTAAAWQLDGVGARRDDDCGEDERDDRVEGPESPLYTPRMDEPALQKDLDRQIATTHRRFVKAMEARLPGMSVDTKERYFGVLSSLVEKLETVEKPMRE